MKGLVSHSLVPGPEVQLNASLGAAGDQFVFGACNRVVVVVFIEIYEEKEG